MKISTATIFRKGIYICLSTQRRDQSKMPTNIHWQIQSSSKTHFSHAFKVIH